MEKIAGRPKAGIEYAGWSVNLFDGDKKIDRLLDVQGWLGFAIYFYLCQMAYKFDGYFYRWAYADSASTARKMGGGVRSGTVEETVRYCLQIGLFDQGLFDRWSILTSRGIQRRYRDAIQKRRVKSVIANYWLLGMEESNGLDLCALKSDLPIKTSDLRDANGDLRAANDTERKEKESNISACAAAHAREDIALVFRCYEQNIGVVPRAAADDILWNLDHGYEPGLLCAAIEDAALHNARNWNYVRAILSRCEKTGIRTRAAYEGEQAARAAKKEMRQREKPEARRGRGNKFLEMLEDEQDADQKNTCGNQLRTPQLERGTGGRNDRYLDDVDWGFGCE